MNLDAKSDGSREALEAAHKTTEAAMRAGADIIYQGTLFDGRWLGRPDFLLRVQRASALGEWSYEVADAKLARHVKASALLQGCVYSDLLAGVQGVAPEAIHVVTGDGQSHRHALAHYTAYFRWVRKQFEERVANAANVVTYPDPVDHCRVCRWYGPCADQRKTDDHLSRVAGMTRAYTKALVAEGLPTLAQLAACAPETKTEGIAPATMERLRAQAALQVQQYAEGKVRYELIRPDPTQPGRGLERLPPPSAGDIFLDFESHPWSGDAGLEYLIGTATEENGAATYGASWAHTPEDEKRAFEALIDLIEERRKQDPTMHVYHYGAYERSAIQRLMGRYATREDEVDQLLRGEVFVDLFEVVRQGVRVSQESYSLKKVEKLYMSEREGPVTQPGFALVEYEHWLRSKEPKILEGIEAYNRDDCISTWKLRAWLEARRPEAEQQFGVTLGRPEPKGKEPSEELTQAAEETRERVRRLTDGIPVDSAERSDEQRAKWLLANLLDWHRRDQKPEWWLYFNLKELPLEQLFNRPEALADLTYVDVVGREARSLIHRYSYDPRQEHKFHKGHSPIDPITEETAGEVVGVDPVLGTIDLKRGASSKKPHPRALIPEGPRKVKELRDAMARVADAVLENGIDGPGPYRAIRDLLLCRPPRLKGAAAGQPLVREGEDIVAAARRIALSLDDTCLPVQGPPGSGKTYTAAQMILDLVREGRRVGIVANAHKAITNLVDAVYDAATDANLKITTIQKPDANGEGGSTREGVTLTNDNKEVVAALEAHACQIVAGTAWLFAREEMENRLDVLALDEAGQMALASVVAMGGAAKSIVLLGDPNQLPQVTKGSHPDGADKSALEHVLGDATTIAPGRGLFLPETRRLHPHVCGYISDAFYDGHLQPHASTHQQGIGEGPTLHGTGLRYWPVPHQGNSARATEEANVVANLIEALLGRPWTNQKGVTAPINIDDILVVAPYNAQVAEITGRVEQRIGQRPRVGTVDKFQGQEGAAVLFSMATSSPEDAPRNMEFLYSRHRLNVAISRARALAVLVCSPDLLRIDCRTPEQMRLVNALCLFLEAARLLGLHRIPS